MGFKPSNIAGGVLELSTAPSSGDLYYWNGSAFVAVTTTPTGRALLDDADTAAQRTTLGLGTIATQDANNVNITGGAISGVTVAQQDDWTTTITTSGTYGRAELNGKVVLVDSTSGNVVISLDPVADWQSGDHFFLAKSVAANSVTINPDGSELISGQATLVLNGLGASVEVKCNGSAFWAF